MFVPAAGEWLPPADCTLLLPAVSVGNVGQLAVDLIISTLVLPKVGYFYTDCLVPMVGNNPYATNEEHAKELCTNAEVYASSDKKLAVLQIRSPLIKKKSRAFCQALTSWMKTCAFSRVVLLSSSHAYQRDDRQLSGTPFRYLVTPALQTSVADTMKALEWKEMEKLSLYPGINDEEKKISIPGGGLTKHLFEDCCSESIHMAVVLKFCSEGDNIPDAFDLLAHVNRWLHLLDLPGEVGTTSWKIPSSWRLLFGSGLPSALF
ncbi:proteasome assembly chaperone 2 [Hyla sarda]|uniref:proteasome assembly chaperone 2 n=1 Tax=Hyla sarda TaxID=327740 RepID=UPI0024C330F4|nr:proteasome assembly chaperone 2 [Hyla sarda]